MTPQELQKKVGQIYGKSLGKGVGVKKFDRAILEKSKAKNQRKQIALLGGAFDPPTLGHIAVARFVLDNSDIEQVWLTPCYKHMYNKKMSSAEQRQAMLSYAVEGDGRIKICNYEIVHKMGGETYHFVNSLMNDMLSQSYEFSYIIGMDNANHFDKWYNYEELERLIRFVVVPRVGDEQDTNVDWYFNSPHIFLRSDKPLPDTSSSAVRESIQLQAEEKYSLILKQMLNPNVLSYIERNKLYIKQE